MFLLEVAGTATTAAGTWTGQTLFEGLETHVFVEGRSDSTDFVPAS
jgi:hypothetical protein